jgi:hypothetical protein
MLLKNEYHMKLASYAKKQSNDLLCTDCAEHGN